MATGNAAPALAAAGLRRGHGVVLGKFLPPHRGHQFLIDFAQRYASRVTVLVCTLEREPIAGALRYEWVRQMCPHDDVDVVHVTADLPQTPDEHPEFWNIWRDVIHRAAGSQVDYFFASEAYGARTAEAIGGGCVYVEVDRPRELRPISGTLVRARPMTYWSMLPDAVKPYFAKRVAIVGPESTGKSTLARTLAAAFNTVYAWEYARPLLDAKEGRCDPGDIEQIARGQIATEDALIRQANRVLICDTDVLTTTLWSDMLFGTTPPSVLEAAEQRTYDLYLVTDVDVPWVSDGQRYFSEQSTRERIRDRFIDALRQRGRPFQIITGDWTTRFATASEAIQRLITD